MAESRPAVISRTAAPPLLLHAAERVRATAGLIGLLALGHLIVDVNSALLPMAAFVGARFLPAPHDRGVAIA